MGEEGWLGRGGQGRGGKGREGEEKRRGGKGREGKGREGKGKGFVNGRMKSAGGTLVKMTRQRRSDGVGGFTICVLGHWGLRFGALGTWEAETSVKAIGVWKATKGNCVRDSVPFHALS